MDENRSYIKQYVISTINYWNTNNLSKPKYAKCIKNCSSEDVEAIIDHIINIRNRPPTTTLINLSHFLTTHKKRKL